MFCTKCGHEVKDGVKFCTNCGAPMGLSQDIKKAADNAFNQAEKELDSAINEVRETIKGNDSKPDSEAASDAQNIYPAAPDKNDTDKSDSSYDNSNGGTPAVKLTDDRGLLSYIVLNIVTCGIYGYYFVYKLAHDLNIACEGDDDNTPGLMAYILLSLVTCGIYSLYWQYKIGNRLALNASRYGLTFQENGTTILMWDIFGIVLCFVGPYVAMYILIKNSNAICNAYNRAHGLD